MKKFLNIHEFLNGARLESARGTGKRNHFDSYLFNSYDTNDNGLKFRRSKLIP